MPQNRLAQLRQGIGWSPQDLADHLGVSSRTIYRWESGETGIPDETKARLCELFHVSLDHLMGWGSTPENGNGDNGESEAV